MTELYRRELTQQDLERMRVPERYWRVQLDGIFDSGVGIDGKPPSPRAVVERYLERIEDFRDRGVGLFLWGPNATGKTCAGVVVLKEFRRRAHSALFMSAAEIHRTVIDSVRFDDEFTLWERAFKVEALLLDDLGKGMQDSTGFAMRMLDELVRYRNANRLVTWFTTNLVPKALAEGPEAFLKQSTLSTIQECSVLVPFQGEDRRKAKADELAGMLFND